jgi:hypothetical protein
MIYYEYHGHCRRLADVPKDATITEVAGRECFGRCEVCRRPILEGQDAHIDQEGIAWHFKCRGVPPRPDGVSP